MNPQNSPTQQPNYAQIALQQRQNGQQSTQQQQPTDSTGQPQQPDPGVLGALQQQVQQGAQTLDSEEQKRLKVNETASPSTASRAMAILHPNGSDQMTSVGKAIQTPAYAGYCLQYVDDQTGNTNRQPTAIADYQARSQQGQIDTSGTSPKGARVYFAPDASNGQMGHVGLSNGNGTFTSATDNGIKTFSIANWEKYTGQKYIGYSK